MSIQIKATTMKKYAYLQNNHIKEKEMETAF